MCTYGLHDAYCLTCVTQDALFACFTHVAEYAWSACVTHVAEETWSACVIYMAEETWSPCAARVSEEAHVSQDAHVSEKAHVCEGFNLSEGGHTLPPFIDHLLSCSSSQTLPLLLQSDSFPVLLSPLLLLQGGLKGIYVLLCRFQNVVCSVGVRINQVL